MNLQAIWISDASMAKLHRKLSYPPRAVADANGNHRTWRRPKSNPFSSLHISPLVLQTSRENKKSAAESTKINSIFPVNTVGIIGGVSVFSTLIFLEKLVWFSSREGEECLPFILSSDPSIRLDTEVSNAFQLSEVRDGSQMDKDLHINNLRQKREFLERSGARCIVMPCHMLHVWHKEISEGCSLPLLHAGECVAKELKDANMKPIEAGSTVKIGVIAGEEILSAGFFQDKLQNQGLEVVLPDKQTVEHIINPAIKALRRKDIEGARNLLRVAIQVLLVRAVNRIILASDELHGLLSHDDPLTKKCINPMDALARSTIKWGKETKTMYRKG